jgi:hypothetical protein
MLLWNVTYGFIYLYPRIITFSTSIIRDSGTDADTSSNNNVRENSLYDQGVTLCMVSVYVCTRRYFLIGTIVVIKRKSQGVKSHKSKIMFHSPLPFPLRKPTQRFTPTSTPLSPSLFSLASKQLASERDILIENGLITLIALKCKFSNFHIISVCFIPCSWNNPWLNRIQTYLGDIAGSVPDHRNKASHTNFLVSQCI